MSGVILAAKNKGAILLVSPFKPSNSTIELLNEMLVSDVIVLGRIGAVSNQVMDLMKSMILIM
ncbi:cell wall-binding repeat-containing protein [Tepidibacillus fermentans]|uniref:cell wall-binding repeat-containing protein n=1 Tax=Tepidibacillus fermentans TaxID=1281767 RepID=UPI001048FDD4|nr:cell wall-binding repeat-containing protein [Tepidibacillus fermentans]